MKASIPSTVMSLLRSITTALLDLVGSLFSLVSSLFSVKQPTPYVCDFCGHRFADPQELVDHLWESHRFPAQIFVNGTVYRSGPSATIKRFLLTRLAEFNLRSS